ncbi:maleylpyruvate isomerase family mycothiol-dependent enzyme [Nocardioides marmoriginsengisoli]|uniref:Maleylpyruvate isomerase family mycothiol-dependent enzyme n=1 Tax=Nocardioides marmoriginsengisoli TaxID=661483 RepID=A0A3N0CAL5_9ACTN|nr:maleylpyruvate isomerase family mycothiol-dependent enzyme [Nocardioides marmoriginsengisoli]RNL60505.1 maleylpyruvate isomerase family mycothiol-dependent enzyme [Nocardioides marmoriginsengisoli]
MNDAPRLAELVETWRAAIAEFLTLVRDVPEDQWNLPTDLDGWDVKDNVAHTAHLEGVLAGAAEETIEVAEAPHIKSLTGFYTEQGVLARRDRTMTELADEIEQAAATRHAELLADPPTDGAGAPPRTPGGIPWDNNTLLSNRPLDVWMHEQDIRRAVGVPGGYGTVPAQHAISRFGGALPMVLGKRVGAPAGTSVRLDVPEAGTTWSARVGDDGRAQPVDPLDDATVRITVSAEDFVVLAGGRRPVEATAPAYDGDAELGRAVLANFSVTP